MPPVKLHLGSSLDVLPRLYEDNTFDSIVTDPPYELAFMAKSWDSTGIANNVDLWRECLRVLKPGGHLLSFGGTRTYHRMACAIEDAGFEIRDQIQWLYGSGFPKSLDVSKALDKAAGAERKIIGSKLGQPGYSLKENDTDAHDRTAYGQYTDASKECAITEPATNDARTWEGWGTALKPAHEPICVARKPLIGTVAANVLQHGTGALNIDGCRVACEGGSPSAAMRDAARKSGNAPGRPGEYKHTLEDRTSPERYMESRPGEDLGRWPANVILDEEAGAILDNQAKDVSRFYYQAKASKSERGEGNTHPTVKPIALMRYLVRLVTPPGGCVLDPFYGSGTTLLAALMEGFDCVGIEQERAYKQIAKARLQAFLDNAA